MFKEIEVMNTYRVTFADKRTSITYDVCARTAAYAINLARGAAELEHPNAKFVKITQKPA